MTKKILALVVSLAALAAMPRAAAAATITVDRTDDPALGPGVSACTAAAGDCSFRGAVAFANLNPGTTISLPAGTYQLTIDGTAENPLVANNAIGDVDIAETTTITGAGAATTILQQTTLHDRVIEFNSALALNKSLTISGVTIAGGRETTGTGGGGIITGSEGGTVTISNCVFVNDQTTTGGVGGAIGHSGGSLNISNTTFGSTALPCATQTDLTCGNQADGDGGAVYFDPYGLGTLTITGSTFQKNVSLLGGGAALAKVETHTVGGTYGPYSIAGSTFLANDGQGAGVRGGAVSALGQVVLTIGTSAFVNNTASGSSARGGAIGAPDGVSPQVNPVTVNFSRFIGNSASAATTLQGSSTSAMLANDNWWGVNTGPTGSQTASATVSVWLQMRNLANPNPIARSSSTTLTADLKGRNTGPALTTELNGLPTFTPAPPIFSAAVLGTLSGAGTQVVDGAVTATFTSGTAAGSGGANATIDSQTVPVSIIVTAPDLTVAKAHVGTFNQGDSGKQYTVTVTNSGNEPTAGTVTVVDTLPAALTATAAGGTGWTGSCTITNGGHTVTCTRSDVLNAGNSYPTLSITVDVSQTAPASVINSVSVSGGNEFATGNDAASDTTPIVPAPATHLSVSAPGTATAGAPFSVTVTALNQFGNTATAYTGTVHFTKSDAGTGSALPANYTFVAGDNGVHMFTNGVTLVTAGTQTVTATDTVTATITGTSATITVSPAAATHFSVSAPASATAGSSFSVTVTALDAFNNTATGYAGTVHFTSTDGQAVLPANTTLTSGAGSFSATLKTAGSQTITATDTVSGSITGTSGAVSVSAAAATHFAVVAPASATAGTSFSFTITADDAFNNTATGYTGTVHFTSTDGAAVLPADSTLTSGLGIFSATLKTAGAQTLTATDTVSGSVTGTSGSIAVSAAAATHFTVTAPASATAGSAFSVAVTALDQFNNTATGYAGTVHFTSTDGAAILPANSTLTSGTGSFSATLKTAGSQTVTATDTVSGSITGTSASIGVSAAAATHFTVTAPPSATSGSAFSVTVTALDAFNNTATAYAGTVHFTSSDGQALLPADTTLASGVGTFSATLKTAGNQTVTATDTVSGSITGTSGSIAVSAGAATHFTLSAPATVTAGGAFSFTATAQDQFGNTATGYAGTVHFTSTDAQAVLPANSTLTSGTGTFSATLKTAGSQTLTATDTVASGVTGTSNSINVSTAGATHFTVSAPASATAGSAFSLTVTALDQFNNVVTGYSGTVHFTSTDGQAVLPANSTLTSGTGTFSATLKTAGNQTITAIDTVNAALTGSSGTIAVAAAATSHFAVSAPASASAGTAFSFSVTALDAFNNTTTGYAGTVHFTATDGAAVLPADSTLTSGTGSFSATLKTAGARTITATDTVSSGITGTSNSITVVAASATHLTVSAPSSATAGTAFSVTVTAQDQFANTATGYVGTVHFTKTDSGAGSAVPSNYTFVAGDNGVHTFSSGVTLVTAGNQTVTATDTVTGSITGTSGTIAVSAAAATHFTVAAPGSSTAGTSFTFTVTARDAFNNAATAYAGTVHFTSTDGAAVLPADSTLTSGAGSFSATLQTTGSQTLTATDTIVGSITGTSNAIAVNAAAATHFAVSGPASVIPGNAFNFTMTALDQFNNTATGYAGTVHFTSSDGQAVLPTDSTLTSGTATFSATLKTTGNQTITATDTVSSSITGTSNAIAVGTAPPNHFVVSAPASVTVGVAFNFTVTPKDAYNNTTGAFPGPVHFTSTDPAAVLPADTGLVGSTTFSATLNTPPSQTITVTGVSDPSTGTSGPISLGPSAELVLTNDDGRTVAVRGAFDTYTIKVSNSGPSAITGATVTDTLPVEVNPAPTTWSCAATGGATCTASGTGSISDTVNLPVGGQVVYTLLAKVRLVATGSIATTATVTLPAGASDPVPGNNTQTDTNTLVARAPQGDFDGDGKSDLLLYNSTTGVVREWMMNGLTQTSNIKVGTQANLSSVIVGTGDYDGNGVADILWQRMGSLKPVLWLNGGSIDLLLPAAPTGAVIVASGDFDGDGTSDILWRNPSTGDVTIWLMSGGSVGATGTVGTLTTDWQVFGAGDFDNDGHDDIFWQNRTTGATKIWFMNGLTKLSGPQSDSFADLAWQVFGCGDYSGDGKSDLLWYTTGATRGGPNMWLMNGATVTSSGAVVTAPPAAAQIVGSGDLDGDGRADVIWLNATSLQVTGWLMNARTVTSQGPIGTLPNSQFTIVRTK